MLRALASKQWDNTFVYSLSEWTCHGGQGIDTTLSRHKRQKKKHCCTPLQIACAKNQKEVLEELRKCKDIDIYYRGNSGCTALYMACLKGNLDIAVELIQHSVDINCSSWERLDTITGSVL